MIRRASQFLVPVAVSAMGCFALVFQGCEKVSPSQPQAAEKPVSYMKDAAFRADLASRREARDELARVHAKLAREMKAKVDATMKRLQIAETNAASIARVKAELEKDPEWNSLSARCKDLVQAIEENRKGAMAAVKARINPDVIKAKALPAKKETSK